MNKKINLVNLSSFIYVFNAMSGSFWIYVYRTQTVKTIATIISLLFIIMAELKNSKLKIRFDLPVILIVTVVLLNNYELKSGVISDTVIFLVNCLPLLFVGIYMRFFEKCMHYAEWFGKFYVVGSYFAALFPSAYVRYIIPIITTNPQKVNLLLNWAKQGCWAGFTEHYSTNAMYLVFMLAILLRKAYILGINSKTNMARINYFWILLTFVALLMTGKRAHCIFSIFALVIVYYVLSPKDSVTKVFKIVLAISSGGVTIIMLSTVMPNILNVVNRFVDTMQSGDVTLGREKLYALALQLFAANKFIGIGWQHFKYISPTVLNSAYTTIHAHNVYLQLLCETGIIGFSIFLIFFLYNLIETVRLRRVRKQFDELSCATLLFSIFMQIFFLLYAFSGNPLYDIQMLFPYMLACGAGQRLKQMYK